MADPLNEDMPPEPAGDRPQQPKPRIGRYIAFSVCATLALMCLLAAAAVVAIALTPSSSPAENMNGIVILALPYPLCPAIVFTVAAIALAPRRRPNRPN